MQEEYQRITFSQIKKGRRRYDINGLIQGCALLKHKFLGAFAANNFPRKLKPNSFLIVEAALAESFGTHWLLLCRKKEDQLFFADPLGQAISSYRDVYQRKISPEESAKIFSYCRISKFKVKTQNFVDFFVFILLIIFLTHKQF